MTRYIQRLRYQSRAGAEGLDCPAEEADEVLKLVSAGLVVPSDVSSGFSCGSVFFCTEVYKCMEWRHVDCLYLDFLFWNFVYPKLTLRLRLRVTFSGDCWA